MIGEPHFMSVPKIPRGGRPRGGERRPSWMPGGEDEKIGDGSNTVRYRREVSPSEREAIREQHRSWLRFILICAAGGITFGFFVAGLILRFDFNGIGHMMLNSPDRFIYTLLLAGGLGSTCGMIAMGVGIMIRASLGK